MENNQYLTVEALTKYLKYRFDQDKNLSKVFLKGEVSNFKRNVRGHLYFTLKDEKAQISCVMFAGSSNQIKFDIRDGMKLLICGKVTIYEITGNYQVYVEEIKEDGLGDLYVAYLQLKEKLEREGYFDQKHKKPIPKFPKKIGVITSSTGAVIQDIINTVNRRYKNTEIILYPAIVQGENSKSDLIEKIKLANLDRLVDVLIIGRGGGSIEDLWSFNDEDLCKTIFQSSIPIISAVGHETDFTICDFVCDLRAPTPTAAAEMATPNTHDLNEIIGNHTHKLNVFMKNIIEQKKMNLLYMDQVLEKLSPKNRIETYFQNLQNLTTNLQGNLFKIFVDKENRYQLLNQRILAVDLLGLVSKQKEKVDYLSNSLLKDIHFIFQNKTGHFEILNQKLKALNPLFIMEKGFSVIYKDDKIVKSIDNVQINDEIKVTLKDGVLSAVVREKEEFNGK